MYTAENDWECDIYNDYISGFDARSLCCACGGGQFTEDSTVNEDSTNYDDNSTE